MYAIRSYYGENEGDLIYSAEHLTARQMALMIRECSGIVCLCLTDEKIRQLELPMMVENNTSRNGTAFTIVITSYSIHYTKLYDIAIFSRMAPAIEVILDRNGRTLQACEEMLATLALVETVV